MENNYKSFKFSHDGLYTIREDDECEEINTDDNYKPHIFDDETITMLGKQEKIEKKKNILSNLSRNIFGKKDNKKCNNTKMPIYNDKFFKNLYNYYYNGGLLTTIISEISDILSSIFGILFILFIFVFLDWNKILQCGIDNELQDCGSLYQYITPTFPNFFWILVILCGIIFIIYKIIYFILNYTELLYINDFFVNVLRISPKKLQTMSWHEVTKNIRTKIKISLSDMTNRIMRKENYIIALIDKNILEISDVLYTKQFELNLEYGISLSIGVIDNSQEIRKLQTRFIIIGIINLLLSLFIFVVLLVYFLASNIDEIYSNKEVIGTRRYSLYAKRKFREYNELLHFFEKRINYSIKYSNEYIKQFPSPTIEVIAKFICLICGSFIGFFLILSVLDESVLLYVRVYNRSLLFYAGIIGAISTFMRGFIKDAENSVYNPTSVMQKIYKYTRYMPKEWEGKLNTYDVRDNFLKLFQYKLVLLIYDLISVITTPYIFIFVLPKQSEKIIKFINDNTVSTDIGLICSYANFDIKEEELLDYKMEKSISLFKENYDSSGVESYFL